MLAATPKRWRLLVDFLSESGLRIGEAIALEYGDIDFGKRQVRVCRRLYRGRIGPPKSRYGKRTIPLTERMAQQLWNAQKASQSPLVFPSSTGGHLDVTNQYRWLEKAGVAAGVPWIGFHSFRHTCATRLFRSGWNARQVQLMLGHATSAFTMAVYVHTLSDELPTPTFESGHKMVTHQGETSRNETGHGVPDLAQIDAKAS